MDIHYGLRKIQPKAERAMKHAIAVISLSMLFLAPSLCLGEGYKLYKEFTFDPSRAKID